MASTRFATKDNLVDLAEGCKATYEPIDAAIVRDASYVHTDANFTQAEKTKLAGIEAGATAGGGTYTLTQDATDGHVLTFAGTDGSSTTITTEDTTYDAITSAEVDSIVANAFA